MTGSSEQETATRRPVEVTKGVHRSSPADGGLSCWPLALAALVLYPILWLLLLPFRIVGIAVEGVLELIAAIFKLPARLLRAI